MSQGSENASQLFSDGEEDLCFSWCYTVLLGKAVKTEVSWKAKVAQSRIHKLGPLSEWCLDVSYIFFSDIKKHEDLSSWQKNPEAQIPLFSLDWLLKHITLQSTKIAQNWLLDVKNS